MKAASYFFMCTIPHQTGCVSPAGARFPGCFLLTHDFDVCCVSGVISRCFLSSSPNLGRRQGLETY